MSEHLEANRGFLDELVAWRRALDLDPGGPADRCAAYLIRCAFEDGSLDWRDTSRRTREVLRGKPQAELALATLALERLLEHMEREVPTREIRVATEAERERLHRYCVALKSRKAVPLHSIPDEHMPEWYFLATARNPWFRGTYPEEAGRARGT